MGLSNQAWLCLDLYDVLARMTEAGHHSAVHQLLDSPIKNCPEVGYLFLTSLNKALWGCLSDSPTNCQSSQRSTLLWQGASSIAAASTSPQQGVKRWEVCPGGMN